MNPMIPSLRPILLLPASSTDDDVNDGVAYANAAAASVACYLL